MDCSESIWLATAMEQSIAFMSRPFGALFIDLQTTLTTEITWRGHLWTCILHHFGEAFAIIDCRYLFYPLPSMLIWCREFENNCRPRSFLQTQQHKFAFKWIKVQTRCCLLRFECCLYKSKLWTASARFNGTIKNLQVML